MAPPRGGFALGGGDGEDDGGRGRRVLLSVLSPRNKSSLILSSILRPPSTWSDVVLFSHVAVTALA